MVERGGVVIIDDDEGLLEVLTELSQRRGFEVLGVADSADAAEELMSTLVGQDKRPDIAIIDGLDGEGRHVAAFIKVLSPTTTTISYSLSTQNWGDFNIIKEGVSKPLFDAMENIRSSE